MSMIKNVNLKTVGVTFINPDGTPRQKLIEMMGDDEFVWLEREPNNLYDKNAIKVMSIRGQIGYLAKDYAQILTEMMDKEGRKFRATIAERAYYKKSWYLHLLVNEVDTLQETVSIDPAYESLSYFDVHGRGDGDSR